MVLFKDVSYKVLQLTTMLGQVNLSALNIFQSKKKVLPKLGLTVYAGIIGTSHFVQVQMNKETIFTELFACETLENQTQKPWCFLPIDKLNNTVYLNSKSFDYQFNCKKLAYDTSVNDITDWAKTAQQNTPFIFLEFDFKTAAQSLPTSRTILVVHEKSNGIAIKTVHEYQEENAIIVTESVVTFLKIQNFPSYRRRSISPKC
jgi:hypothetical protein